MADLGDHRGPVSDVIDRLLYWSLPTIRAEFGDEVGDVISSSLPSRVCGRDFTLRYMPGDSGVDYGQGGSQGSASGGLGESHDGSQNSFPSSRRASHRSDRGRGRPRSVGRCTPTPALPQTWWDGWDGVDQCGPGPEIDRASVEEAMGRWSGPTAPDVVFLEPVKLLQLLAMFHLYCPWHKGSCRVSVESVSYLAQLCKLTFTCDKKCKWTWHTTLVTTNVYQSRLMQQLFHATVTAGLTFTLLDNFCVCLGMYSVHKPTFYKFMRTELGGAEGWNAKVVRQGIKYCEFVIDTVMRRGEPVTLMVDGRYDSARGAQHCTVTTMEYKTQLVVGVHTLRPKIEGKASNALEVPAVVQLLRGLMDKGLKIRCVVSDNCAALRPKLRAMNIKWQKDCHHKIKNIRKHFHNMLQLKEAKKVSSPHDCVSEAQFMQFTKKRLKEALEQRFGPDVLTPAEERLKKSDFVAVVMRKIYPYGSRLNARALETDPDGLTEYHAHEVGMWFLRACQLCMEEGGDADSLHRDIMLVADHWAGDHSGCVDGREVLCEKAGWDGVDQCGPGPEIDRASVEEAMGRWSGPTAPDVVFLEPVKLLQLLAMFHLYCPWHKGSCRVSVESVSYLAQLCKLTFTCDKKCKWTWHTTLVTTNVYQSRLMQQLFHATVTAGLTFTLLDNFCVCLGMYSVHKPTFYKFMRTELGGAEGWNAKVVRQGIKYCEFVIDTVMRRGEPVTLMVDGRYDSARGAQHCTVTTMEYKTQLVVGVHTLRPKIEGKASNALEVPAVVQLLRGLMDKGLKIRCVVSDNCAALRPKLRAMNIKWQKDCHHKIKNIRKHFHNMLQLKEAKKVSSPHDCVSEAQFMQFTKKRLKEALEQRFGPDVLTPAEERLKKSDFVAVVMRKIYPYGSRLNARALETDPDGLTEYHAHEGTIIIYAKKSVHFEKSFCARLSIAVIRWNSHCWRDLVGYVARIAAGTSIRARPGFRRHYGHEAIDCWEDRLAASVFGSTHVSDWARELLRQEVCPYGAGPLPYDLFVNGGGDPMEVVDDAASDSDHEAVGENRVFIIGHVEDDVVPACDDWVQTSSSESEGDDIELFSV
ncbi:hypothetical protein CBR_g12140 [Chara braunii]|uniref:Uncharacterized protein n=1 Tax=Chara braunii TaxID=69332 RepID=A0A388KR73_CHABU|nr:hypothetical protein CBR_g12140 [Chara braunii]|eukprot:GBG72570.1 hypothetical protein CBR_g12140 [Chara braunii]